MKKIRRGSTAERKNASQKLLWLGAITTAPSFGTCSRPVTRIVNTSRSIGISSSRTSQ